MQYQQVRKYTITSDEDRQRVDNFLLNQYKSVPKSHIYKMIRAGEVRVNGKRVRAMQKLFIDDLVRLPPYFVEPQNTDKIQLNSNHSKLLQQIEKSIIFEDDNLLIIDKPNKLSVHSGGGKYSTNRQIGLIEIMQQIDQWKKLELAHRLDKDTSGCLVMAKRKKILRDIHQLFRRNQVNKKYTAIVHHQWHRKNCTIDKPLLRYLMPNGERKVKVDKQGQTAKTHIKTIKNYPNHSLVEISPLTGKTHQIRVHCQWAKNPIIGDEKYGDRELDKLIVKQNRLYLHASEISFIHPITNLKITIKSPLPKSFEQLIEQIKD